MCKKHDNDIFKPIEDGNIFTGTEEQCFLHSFRAFIYSYHRQKEFEQSIKSNIDHFFSEIKNVSDNIQEEISQSKIPNETLNTLLSSVIDGDNKSLSKSLEKLVPNSEKLTEQEVEALIRKGEKEVLSRGLKKSDLEFVKDEGIDGVFNKFSEVKKFYEDNRESSTTLKVAFEPIRKKLLNIYFQRDFSQLYYVSRIINKTYSFASTGCFYPKIIDENSHSVIFPNQDASSVFPCIMLTIIPDEQKRTIVILSCLKSDYNSSFYLSKLNSIKEENEFYKAISGILLKSCPENTFFNPQLWDCFCENDKDKLIAREINKERPFDKLNEKVYLSSINLFE